VLKENPSSQDAYILLFDMSRSINNYALFVLLLLKIISLNEYDPIPYFYLGHIYSFYGGIEKALKCFQKTTELGISLTETYSDFLKIHESKSLIDIYYDDSKSLAKKVRGALFELSNICNYSNKHLKCPAHFTNRKIVLPTDLIHKTLDEFASFDFEGSIGFNGYNEPLIDPRLFSILDYARRACPKVEFTILTNGFYLSQEIADELHDYGVSLIQVTAYSQSEYDRISSINYKTRIEIYPANMDERLNFYDKEELLSKMPCYQPLAGINIRATGDVVLCCLDWKMAHIFGNIKTENIVDIINKPNFVSAFHALRNGDRIFPICRGCDQFCF
jgi:MoaA/NifB/PqqE/SkfB family radical SAM enzyme